MRSMSRVLVALVFGVLGLGLAACGGGGGGSGPSGGLSLGGSQNTTTATNASANTPSASTSSPVVPGSVSVTAVDYFTHTPITGAVVSLDNAPLALTGNTTTAVLMPTSGLHTLTVAAADYATYNGGVQTSGGAATRQIPLFPVSSLMVSWLARVNADRSANGRGNVALDDMLTIAAYDHAVDMGTRNYFAHFDTHGFAPTTRSLLLGSMMMAAENIAAGYSSWAASEDAFMNEKNTLPNKSPEDCLNDQGAAGHYCNIVWADHTYVGLAAASVGGSQYRTYYDQEFGDLYGQYDTTVVSGLSVGTSINLNLAPAGGASYQSQAVATEPVPTAISVATLNGDPTCESSCPSTDYWYPPSPVVADGTQSVHLSLTSSQLYFVAQYTSITSYVGAGSWALAWPSESITPDTYTIVADNITSQSIARHDETAGHLVANPRKMNAVY